MAADNKSLDALKIQRPTAPAPQRGGTWIVIVLITIAIAAGILWWLNRPKTIAVQTAQARSVAAGGARTLLNASGYVTARRAATVSSKVTGRVMDVLVEEGLRVEEGQILAHLDDSNAKASLALAEAQLESARQALGETDANLALADRTLERTTNLAAAKVVSISDLDRASADVASLRARLVRQKSEISVADHQVALWRQQCDDMVIRAPFAGVVTSKNAQPGEMISPMSAGGFTRTGIYALVDMTSLEVEVDVNESYINRVSPGQPVVVTLDSYPDWRISARVIAIIPAADRQKATVRVRVGFEALDPRILPDMGLKVAFQEAENTSPVPMRATVVVPSSAIRRDGDRDVVWIVRDGRLERRAVTVGARNGNESSIAAGLTGGEKVVIQGPDTLAEGTRVSEQQS